MIKTFEEWFGEKGIKIEEVSAILLPTAYKVWGTECYHEAKELKSENEALRNEADENAALSMQNKMRADRLEKENAALRERLSKAVELKAKVGDTIYMPWIWDGTSGIAGIIVREIQIVSDGVKYYVTSFTTDNLAFAAHYKFGKFQEDYFGKMVFTTRETATVRLAELKGDK